MKNRYRWFTVLLAVLILPSISWADFLGIKDRGEYVSFELMEPLDSSGIPLIPDSVHVFTYADDAASHTYTTRSTTYPFAGTGVDTTKNYGDTTYFFSDQIQDIDAGTESQLAIAVTFFCDGLPTTSRATVQIITDSLLEDLDAIAVIDGVVDGIQTEVDNIDGSAIPTDESIAQAVMDSTRNEAVSDTTAGSYWAFLARSIEAIRDTAQFLVTATGFSTFDYTSNKVTVVDSTAGDVSYVANNQADYKASGFATSTDMALVLDSLGKINDSLQATLDSIQLHAARLDSLLAAVTDGHIVKYNGGAYIQRLGGWYVIGLSLIHI